MRPLNCIKREDFDEARRSRGLGGSIKEEASHEMARLDLAILPFLSAFIAAFCA